MTNISSRSSHIIIIDANVAVWAVVPTIAEIETLDRLQQWHQEVSTNLAQPYLGDVVSRGERTHL